MNTIIKDLLKNNRELCIFEIVKKFDLKYSQASVIVDAHTVLNELAKANDSIEAWEALVDVVYANIMASYNMTVETLNEIYEFSELKADEDEISKKCKS